MKLLFAILFVISATIAEASDPRPLSVFSRPDPALRLVKRSDSYEKGSFASWAGKLVLTGKVVFEFDRAPPDDPDQRDIGVAFFEPDVPSLKKLPQAVGNYYPLRANVIWLGKEPEELLPALVGSDMTRKVLAGREPRFEVPARVRLLKFETSVECDHRSYWMNYDSLVALSTQIVAIGEAKDISC